MYTLFSSQDRWVCWVFKPTQDSAFSLSICATALCAADMFRSLYYIAHPLMRMYFVNRCPSFRAVLDNFSVAAMHYPHGIHQKKDFYL